jgi:hypothetical protein
MKPDGATKDPQGQFDIKLAVHAFLHGSGNSSAKEFAGGDA